MRSVELFVGAGGLALGTAKAGFRHDIVIECNPHAVATLRQNKAHGVKHVKDWVIFPDRVEKFDYSVIASGLDLISAGPPCQPFSLGGKHRGHEDERNLFPEVFNAIRILRPKAFMVENVKGLLRKTFEPYYSYIIHQLRYPNHKRRNGEEWTDHLKRLLKHHQSNPKPSADWYVVKYKLLNAADYGVPQRRERVIIVGVRADLDVSFEYPAPTHSAEALFYSKWVTGEYWRTVSVPVKHRPVPPSSAAARIKKLKAMVKKGKGVPVLQPWVTVRQAIMGLPVLADGGRDPNDPNHFLNPGARSYKGHTGSPLDEPAKTLKAGDHGVPGGENTLRLGKGGKVRYFSVREAARLQTFPDEYVLEGAWTEGLRQLGNAVPVRLAEVVAKELAKTIK